MFILYSVVTLFLVVCVVSTNETAKDGETGEVIFVNVLHRHGARTPAYFYPTDPYNNESYWPEKKGQLTNTGKKQAFELGQWLRQRYNTLLTDRYDPDNIYVQSTDYDRTLMSAECVLAGMFPPRGAQVWSDDLSWQPIPVHTTPLKQDKILGQPPRSPCPAYELEKQTVFNSDEKIKQLNETFSELFEWINTNSGANFTLLDVYKIYDTLSVESIHNLTLPDWTKRVFPEPMLEAYLFNFQLVTWTPKLARLMTGLLIGDMIQNMVDKMQNKTSTNVHIYSAHDETIGNVLNALGAFNHRVPPYASCLMLELRVGSDGKHFIALYYHNSTIDGPYLMQVAGCTPMCPLDQFISLSQPLIPEDWDRECSITDDSQGSYGTAVGVSISSLISAILIRWLCN